MEMKQYVHKLFVQHYTYGLWETVASKLVRYSQFLLQMVETHVTVRTKVFQGDSIGYQLLHFFQHSIY